MIRVLEVIGHVLVVAIFGAVVVLWVRSCNEHETEAQRLAAEHGLVKVVEGSWVKVGE